MPGEFGIEIANIGCLPNRINIHELRPGTGVEIGGSVRPNKGHARSGLCINVVRMVGAGELIHRFERFHLRLIEIKRSYTKPDTGCIRNGAGIEQT